MAEVNGFYRLEHCNVDLADIARGGFEQPILSGLFRRALHQGVAPLSNAIALVKQLC